MVLLLHDERPRVRHLRVARERELPNAVGEDELLRARRLVHGRGACDARARVQLFLVGRAGCGWDIEDDDGSAILTKKRFIGQLKVDAIKC